MTRFRNRTFLNDLFLGHPWGPVLTSCGIYLSHCERARRGILAALLQRTVAAKSRNTHPLFRPAPLTDQVGITGQSEPAPVQWRVSLFRIDLFPPPPA
jgi:hypothetical protein